MLYSICPECQHHNRIASEASDSIPPEWKQQQTCAVCDKPFTADASNSYIVPVKSQVSGAD